MQPNFGFVAVLLVVVTMASSCSTPISTREQGGLIGAGVGAGAGAFIGSTVGDAAAAR